MANQHKQGIAAKRNRPEGQMNRATRVQGPGTLCTNVRLVIVCIAGRGVEGAIPHGLGGVWFSRRFSPL